MARTMFFGTKGHMRWIPCPRQGADLSRNRYSNESGNLNGSFGLYQSVAGAKTYEFDFGFQHAADINHLLNIDAGIYGRDVYFNEPFASQTNALPIHWSAPALAMHRVPNLMGKDKYRQAVTLTPANDYGYPEYTAIMGDAEGNDAWLPAQSLELWIPVPQGYTFHYGAHSPLPSSNAVYVGITPDGGSEVIPTLLNVNTATLTNYAYTPGTDSGVTLRLNGNPASTSYLTGLIAQILPNGKPAPTGDFIVGRGHSGCRIVGGITEEGYSAPLDWEQYSGVFKEFGNWVDD